MIPLARRATRPAARARPMRAQPAAASSRALLPLPPPLLVLRCHQQPLLPLLSECLATRTACRPPEKIKQFVGLTSRNCAPADRLTAVSDKDVETLRQQVMMIIDSIYKLTEKVGTRFQTWMNKLRHRKRCVTLGCCGAGGKAAHHAAVSRIAAPCAPASLTPLLHWPSDGAISPITTTDIDTHHHVLPLRPTSTTCARSLAGA